MTTTPGQRAAVDLAAVREQWGDLLAAIEQPPAAEWPPRECAGFLDHPAAARAADDPMPAEPAVGRTPLTLREHPAPLNLTALDAALSVERDLFDLADAVAEQVQHPATSPDARTDPARWNPPTYRDALPRRGVTGVFTGTDPRTPEDREAQAKYGVRPEPVRSPAAVGTIPVASAGSRAYGLHWAAVWLEGRALDEPGPMFRLMPIRLADQVAAVAARARRTVERALNRDRHTVTLNQPCPYCRGPLTGQTTGNLPEVYCGRGEECPAPVVLDHRRRIWRGAALVDLWSEMLAAREPEQQSA